MRPLLLNLVLALAWLALTGEFTRDNFFAGLILSYGLLWMFRSTLFPHNSYFRKLPQAVYFVAFFLWQLLLSNLRVAWEVLSPRQRMRPAIVAIPLDIRGDLQITLLANLITLTPGTLSLDVSDDEKILFVHTMYLDKDDHNADKFRQSIKQGFEKRVQELFA